MAEERIQRRLAAILAADVVGYGQLMERDDAGTLAALKSRRRDVLDPIVAKHQGRIFKVTGDGVLIEFASAVNAVQCAVDLQHGMAATNDDQPEDLHIVLRIEVNLGDVLVEGSDLYGDGINIAARLEALADPGGILVSGTAYDHTKNKIKIGFNDLGAQNLKNIAEPIRAYRVASTPVVAIKPPNPTSEKPSIAVLPFINMSGNSEEGYFSDGITEDIITELSRWKELRVLSRHSSFQYRDKATDVQQAGRDLGVGYVVEGSVRRIGERLRVTAQLIDTVSGGHIWAERYDREANDVFAVQENVVQTLVGTLVGRVRAAGVAVAKRKSPSNLDAYECVLRGRALPWSEPDSEATQWYQKAIDLDPNYGLAHALLALMVETKAEYDSNRSEALLDQALELARKAVDLDENESMGYSVLGKIYLQRGSFDLAEKYNRRALEINPNNPEHMTDMGDLLIYLGRPEEAIEWLDRAKRTDPFFAPAWYWSTWGLALYLVERYDDAIVAYERSTLNTPWIAAYIGACHAQAGRLATARKLSLQRYIDCRN